MTTEEIREEFKKELEKKIDGMMKDITRFTQNEEEILLNVDYGYNQALQDIKALLKEQ